MSDQLPLFDAPAAAFVTDPAVQTDLDARAFAADPERNVFLEASAGTGKTTVLVARYVNLLLRGVDPSNILAITFTRKAAAEMRARILAELRRAASQSAGDRGRWTALRDRLADIQISTIDAFCLSLLREFPLEADLDPGFDLADETEVPRLIGRALDRAMRIFVSRATREPELALVLAQLGIARTREGLAHLLERRIVAWDVLDRFLARGPEGLTAEDVCRAAVDQLTEALAGVPGGLPAFVDGGPLDHPRYRLLARDLRALRSQRSADVAAIRGFLDRLAAHFLTTARKRRNSDRIHPYKTDDYPNREAGRRHRAGVLALSPRVEEILHVFTRDLNGVFARGIRRMFAIARAEYARTLQERSVLDFSDVLSRAVDLLRRMDEFSQSRFRLEGRYHHVLVDELQDTSRRQWELVALLVQAWGEGLGVAGQTSIFVVGDRKQSIYRFRDAEVAVMHEAARFIDGLRPQSRARRSITRSFRAVPELLAFVNSVFAEVATGARRPDDFKYDADDRFPVVEPRTSSLEPRVLGLAAAEDVVPCAAAVADEIVRLLREAHVRDRETGVMRRARPGDVAILFRSRASHREFERELERRGIPSYVYKGLGFFDADEIKDALALVRFLANPASDLRAAALLRSRLFRLSDAALARLAPNLAAALTSADAPEAAAALDDEDAAVLALARAHVPAWLERVDRVPPADLFEDILPQVAYAWELRGPRAPQAWENLKKMRGLIRRIQNRGYATVARLAGQLDFLSAGDESNAVIEALDAVNLMTVHAAKGLEFPIVFVVNLAKGASGPPRPVRLSTSEDGDGPSVSIGTFASEADEDDRVREREETKRLLYVALTRARDRLYLATVLKDGVMVPGRGSLGDVVPPSLREIFSGHGTPQKDTDGDPATVDWTAADGQVFTFRVCPASADQAESVAREADVERPYVPPIAG